MKHLQKKQKQNYLLLTNLTRGVGKREEDSSSSTEKVFFYFNIQKIKLKCFFVCLFVLIVFFFFLIHDLILAFQVREICHLLLKKKSIKRDVTLSMQRLILSWFILIFFLKIIFWLWNFRLHMQLFFCFCLKLWRETIII